MCAAAAPMEPVLAIPSSKSALPGPKAIFVPRLMRKRGRRTGRPVETFFVFMKGVSVGGRIQICKMETGASAARLGATNEDFLKSVCRARNDSGIDFWGKMQLGRITIFPIKSLDGVPVETARITRGGILENDRIYAIYDADGKVVNGKRTPRVHELRCEFDAQIAEVRLGRDGESPAQFQLDDPLPLGKWLGNFFGFQVVLRHEPQKGFPDDAKAFGPTVVSEASLRRVQSWFPEMTLASARRRFRANLELSDGEPFCEDRLFGAPDELKPFHIGAVNFLGHNPCQRCVVPTRDPDTAQGITDFQKKFMRLRQEQLPAWANAQRFNHFYRFAVNTSIPPTEAGKPLRIGDRLEL